MQDFYIHSVKSYSSDIFAYDQIPKIDQFKDKRSSAKKKIDYIIAIMNEIVAIIKFIANRLLYTIHAVSYSEYCDPTKKIVWKKESQGLHILNYGLHNHPCIWNNYIEAIRKNYPQEDIQVPFISKNGNCSLESAARPIQEIVRSYIEQQIEQKQDMIIPIALYGFSNGTRITLRILHQLLDENLKQKLHKKNIRLAIQVNLLSGVLTGTNYWVIRFANWNKYSFWIASHIFRIHPDLIKDYQYKGEASQQLIKTISKIEQNNYIQLKFNYFASTEDVLVTPYVSCLPIAGHADKETHYITHQKGHISLIDSSLDEVMKINKEWRGLQEKEWNNKLAKFPI